MDSALHDKLAKILRLAERAATEGERLAALSRAQEIAFKHNLDLSQVDIEEKQTSKVGTFTVGSLDSEWKMDLYTSLARVNFCDVIFHGDARRPYVYLVGKQHNIEVVRAMYDYLMPQMEEEAMREVARRGQLPRYALVVCLKHAFKMDLLRSIPEMLLLRQSGELDQVIERSRQMLLPLLKGETGLGLIMRYTGLTKSYASEIRPYIKRGEIAPEIVDDLKVWAYSFKTAMVHRIYKRLWDQRKDLAAEADAQALVLREDKAVEDYIESLNAAKVDVVERNLDLGGYAAGREAGDRVSLEQRETLQGTSGRELGA